jgi:hypothetical protein
MKILGVNITNVGTGFRRAYEWGKWLNLKAHPPAAWTWKTEVIRS